MLLKLALSLINITVEEYLKLPNYIPILCDNGDADVEKRGHARSERVGGGVPAPPRNVAADKRAIPTNPANPPLIRRFTPPSHMGEGFEKNVHRPKFIIDFSH